MTNADDDRRLGGGTCPYCGVDGSVPADSDSWWCPSCRREYPAFAWKCGHPDCWEFAWDYCARHQPQAEKGKTDS